MLSSSSVVLRCSLLPFLVLSAHAVGVEHRVLTVLEEKGTCNVLVHLKEKPHVARKLLGIVDPPVRLLQEAAEEHQKEFVTHYGAIEGLEIRSFYIVNYVAVDGVTSELLEEMKGREDVLQVYSNEPGEPVQDILDVPFFDEDDEGRRLGFGPIDPPIYKTGVETLRELGFSGQGIVVGISSTGVNVYHEALRDSYRGYNKDTGEFNHDYSWMDGFLALERTPIDTVHIGTHLTGVVAGTKKNIGVAPGSKFIGCRSIDGGGRDTPEVQIRCLQFFFAPTPADGNKNLSRKSMRPHIVYTPYSESSLGEALREPINKLLDVGILVIAPSGPSQEGNTPCLRTLRAPSTYEGVLTVGALANDGTRLATSGGGPILKDGAPDYNLIKPDLVALGQSVVSSVYLNPNSLYFAASGTPVAAAVAAGAAAVFLSARPCLIFQQGRVRELLRQSANPIRTTDCFSPLDYPNFLFGFGDLNLTKAAKTCSSKGTVCESRSDCCPGLSCRKNPTTGSRQCQACLPTGSPCSAHRECCCRLQCNSFSRKCSRCGRTGGRCRRNNDCCPGFGCNLSLKRCANRELL